MTTYTGAGSDHMRARKNNTGAGRDHMRARKSLVDFNENQRTARGPPRILWFIPRKDRSGGPRYSPPRMQSTSNSLEATRLPHRTTLVSENDRHARSTPGHDLPLSPKTTLQKKQEEQSAFRQILPARGQKKRNAFRKRANTPVHIKASSHAACRL